MTWHQHVVVNFLAELGQALVQASCKPELLSRSLVVPRGDVSPLCAKQYTLPPPDFVYRGNIELYECPVKFWNYFGFIWPFYTLIEFLEF